MKADAKPTLEEVASLLCKGKPVPDWVVPRLRKHAALVGDKTKTDPTDDEIDRKLLESADQLEKWLGRYTMRVYEMVGEEIPDCIEKVLSGLEELMPLIAEGVRIPKRGRPLDDSRHLCAAVCMKIWSEFHHRPQPHSPKLWEACEAYWVACGHPANPSGHIKSWEDYLRQNIDHPLIASK
jgi:hypothetical protein